MTRENRHYIWLLQQRANKPIEELNAILNELEKMEQTTKIARRLESIISRLKTWQQC